MVGAKVGPDSGAKAAGGARLLTPTPAGERHAHGDRFVAARAITTAPVRSIESSTRAEDLMRAILEEMGEDPGREGLLETPRRVRESLAALTAGYEQDPAAVVGGAIFEESYDEMVVVRDIELYSLCEHHLLPFYGKAHIAYIPDGRIVGLSKLPRLVDVFARRLQVQERLTTQVAETVQELLRPRGVGVVIEASHLCMMMRGVQKQNSTTITSCMLGEFKDDQKTRAEFLQLVQGR